MSVILEMSSTVEDDALVTSNGWGNLLYRHQCSENHQQLKTKGMTLLAFKEDGLRTLTFELFENDGFNIVNILRCGNWCDDGCGNGVVMDMVM